MTTQKMKAEGNGAKRQGVVFGQPPEPGTAGPEATYIMKSLERFRLRGDGVLGKKK
ncbi:hypothetical protein [Desulfarculus baarsii]